LPDPAKTRPLRLALALVALALVAALALAWLNRRSLAREALTGWLAGKGVAARAEVEAIGPTTFTARLSIGDPRAPDFAADRVAVRYRLTLSGLDVLSARLERPVLRARLHDGRFSVGALDPIVRDFLRRPPRPNAAKPRIEIVDGRLLLATDYGPLQAAANALVDNGQLKTLAATSAPARLRGPGFELALGAATLRETTRAGRIAASLEAPLAHARAGEASLGPGQLSLKVGAPYPDFARQRGDGELAVALHVAARDAALPQGRFARAELTGGFTGRTTGWIANLAVNGRLTGAMTATGGAFGGGARLATLHTSATSDLAWTRAGGDRLQGRLTSTATAQGVATGAFAARSLTAAASGPFSASAAGLDAALTGSLIGKGGWSGLGAPAAADDPSLAALKRAARSFHIAAPGLAFTLRDGRAAFALPEPVQLIPDTGGVVRLAAASGGAWRLTAAGGGLPSVEAEVADLTARSARLRLKAHGDFAMARGAALEAAGRLSFGGGVVGFAAARCATWRAERLELGVNDVTDLSGRFCPTREPMFRMAGGGWRIAGRAEDAALAVPVAQVAASGGAGPVAVVSRGGRLGVQARLDAGRLTDAAPQPRFNPLALSGAASLSDYVWRADIGARLPGGPSVVQVHAVHDGGLGVGFATLKTGTLTFADGGLQPAQLSPLAASLGPPVEGAVSFDGRFDWTRSGAASQGVLAIEGLDFQSPAGRVHGLAGEIRLASLAPLTAEAGQTVRIAQLDAIVPVTSVNATFAITDEVLRISGGEAEVGGGRIRVEDLELPFAPDAAMRGVLAFEGVQLHDLVEASPFGDKVELDAKVSGRVPFESQAGKVRIAGGELKAIQPGRLSIDRTALSGVQTQAGAIPAADDPNATFTGFAYQAMEDLAFDTLEASVASQPDGRLGVLFHIVGRHDPPKKQQIKMSLLDLIQRKFLGKPLPLPSGTQVNLTLDTTLNLDDLLADYANYRKLRGSGAVQP
jgi:hypothetical protein